MKFGGNVVVKPVMIRKGTNRFLTGKLKTFDNTNIATVSKIFAMPIVALNC